MFKWNNIFSTNISAHFKFKIQNLSVKKGELLLICGTFGTGKSHFIEIILGLNSQTSGDFLFKNTSLEKSRTEFNKNSFFILQNPFLQILEFTVKDYLQNNGFSDIANNNSLNSNIIEKKIFKEHNLDYLFDRTINSLSGGEIQQLILATGLANKNKNLFILDSPFEMMDSDSQKKFIKNIKSEKNKGKTFIVASKNPIFLEESNKLIILEKETSTLLKNPIDILKNVKLFSKSGMNLSVEIVNKYY